MGAKELGATVACCGGNPLTTQDDIAAFLASQGIMFIHGMDNLSKTMIGVLIKYSNTNQQF